MPPFNYVSFRERLMGPSTPTDTSRTPGMFVNYAWLGLF